MNYLYTFGYRPEEKVLCELEMRAFFEADSESNVLHSDVRVEPSRSPFMRERLAVMCEVESFEELAANVCGVVAPASYRVVCLNSERVGEEEKMSHGLRREVERTIGMSVQGEVDLDEPACLYGVVRVGEKWLFGELVKGQAVWLRHGERPVPYSTALSAKHARALVNIAAPEIGVSVIDPCCGVGTVLIEACSMGVQIVGRDMNWFATSGARKNLAHFGFECDVQLGRIEDVTEQFDVAIVDMPYNVFTHSSEDEKLSIIRSARRIARRVLFVSSEPLQQLIEASDFTIVDRCLIPKQQFVREVLVCE